MEKRLPVAIVATPRARNQGQPVNGGELTYTDKRQCTRRSGVSRHAWESGEAGYGHFLEG